MRESRRKSANNPAGVIKKVKGGSVRDCKKPKTGLSLVMGTKDFRDPILMQS